MILYGNKNNNIHKENHEAILYLDYTKLVVKVLN